MPTHSLSARLTGFGVPATAAALVVEELTPRQRFTRAGAAAGVGLAAALIAIPIPLVHFVLVPGSLLIGAIVAARRLGQREIFRSAEGPCPFCGTTQRLGLAGQAFRLPRRLHCATCGQELDLDAG
jgi:hypothetical protein